MPYKSAKFIARLVNVQVLLPLQHHFDKLPLQKRFRKWQKQ